MKLSRLYSNLPAKFAPIDFVEGLNVVLAEIRLPKNQERDTHNLGKTTLGRVLDFCFLASRDSKFFLFRHPDLFGHFVFFLELCIAPDSYVTVRRAVNQNTRIAFKRHSVARHDFSDLPDANWDHWDVPFQRARDLLDSYVDWRALKDWGYRKGLGYLLRSQDDYGDVFQLQKFANKHADWKPLLADMLGFDGKLIQSHYAKEEELEEKSATAKTIAAELGGTIEDSSKIEGKLLLKRRDVERKQKELDAFDFRAEDKQSTKELVDNVDEQIARLNERRYTLTQSRKKITAAIEEDQILFDPKEAEKIFDEAGVLFKGQLKKDFTQLLAFNKAITEERRGYLVEERDGIDAELKVVGAELNKLGKRRSQLLQHLGETHAFSRYRQVSSDLVTLRADIESLERQRAGILRLHNIRTQLRALSEEKDSLQISVEKNVDAQNASSKSRFSIIRLFFNEIIEEVIDRKALLSVSTNSNGHLEFKAEILDEGGNATSADAGHTYRKLLCIAFDLAVLRAHIKEPYPRFVFHDGVFESLDPRKKEKLIGVLRSYVDLGIQPVITSIISDLPPAPKGKPVFAPHEIVLTLHDEGDQGRLFKMQSW
jgi:uncharacterized protein YydD (DUF2326 family)